MALDYQFFQMGIRGGGKEQDVCRTGKQKTKKRGRVTKRKRMALDYQSFQMVIRGCGKKQDGCRTGKRKPKRGAGLHKKSAWRSTINFCMGIKMCVRYS